MPEEMPKAPWRHSREERVQKKRPPVLVRFTGASGEVWTVWDITFSKFKNHRHSHCDSVARARVFVNAAGVKRCYSFKREESRVLDPEFLERQLREAGFVGDFPDVSRQRPR